MAHEYEIYTHMKRTALEEKNNKYGSGVASNAHKQRLQHHKEMERQKEAQKNSEERVKRRKERTDQWLENKNIKD